MNFVGTLPSIGDFSIIYMSVYYQLLGSFLYITVFVHYCKNKPILAIYIVSLHPAKLEFMLIF